MSDSDAGVARSADITEEEFQDHREEINQFIDTKVAELGLHQTIRLIGHAVTSKTSLYRANNVENGNPELVTLCAQDHASSMTYWAEVEIGVREISGLPERPVEPDEHGGEDGE